MDEAFLVSFYREEFNLKDAHFELIEHNDAMVAIVYKVTLANRQSMILKICSRKGDYLRELYFLKHFANQLPVPHIIQHHCCQNIPSAILMEYISGKLISEKGLNDKLAYEMGTLLACIHANRTSNYGDLTQSESLTNDPRTSFTLKFEEGLEECKKHLSSSLLKKCYHYYSQHVDLLIDTDGPCIIHRDFRPGNVIVNEGQIKGIIDWSSARSGFAEEDFGIVEIEQWCSLHKDSFFSGYASIRKIPDYSRILPLLGLSKAIGAIGFTVKQKIWQDRGAKLYQFNLNYLERLFNNN